MICMDILTESLQLFISIIILLLFSAWFSTVSKSQVAGQRSFQEKRYSPEISVFLTLRLELHSYQLKRFLKIYTGSKSLYNFTKDICWVNKWKSGV